MGGEPVYRAICVLAILSGAAAFAQKTPSEVLRSIIAANNTADLKSVANLYADDAIWLPPSGPTVEGKTAIVARYKQSFVTVKLHYTFNEVENHASGDWAFSRGTTEGTATPTAGGAPRKIHDKYLMILHRVRGQWKIARLMWSPAT